MTFQNQKSQMTSEVTGEKSMREFCRTLKWETMEFDKKI
jgi:hypothetical protein